MADWGSSGRTFKSCQPDTASSTVPLPAETRPEGFAPGGCHAAREHGSTCQLSALPHGAAARTTVCMFGSLKPSDRSSELRSFGLSEADHSGSLSGSRPMQQRLVCVEAGQTFSIQRMEVLTPQVSSTHWRLTRGRSLVRSQPGPSQVLAGKPVGRRTFVILFVGRAARYRGPYRATYRHLKSGTSFGLEWVPVTALGLGRPAWVARVRVRWLAAPAGV